MKFSSKTGTLFGGARGAILGRVEFQRELCAIPVKRPRIQRGPKACHVTDQDDELPEEEEDRPWHKRVPYPDHKERCQAIGAAQEQCSFYKLPGGDYCFMHGQGLVLAAKKQTKKLYDLQKYREKVDKLAQDDPNLDEELGIQRMVLQEMLNQFEGLELITQSGKISQVIKEIRETMTSNQKLKSQLGQLMDRASISRLCDAIVVIVAKHVPPERIDSVVAEVAGAVATAVSERQS